MQVEFWGATEPPGFLLPQRPLIATALLLLYVITIAVILYRRRRELLTLGSRDWLITALLSLAGLLFSQLFLIPAVAESYLPPLVSTQNPRVMLAFFGALPMLLAGATMGAGPALIVGFFTGLSRGLWGSHQIFDPFYFALAGAFAGWWCTQNYEGRVYEWMRLPVVSGPLSLVLLLPAFFPALFAYASVDATWLAALDWSISTTRAQFLPLLLEGLIGGVIASLIVVLVPQVRVQPGALQPAPQHRSVRNRLLINFAVFAILLSTTLLAVVFSLSVTVAERLSINQMEHDAAAVSRQIPAFRTQTQNLLRQYSDSPVLTSGDEDEIEAYLGQLVRTAGAYYRRVILVDTAGEISAFYPNSDDGEEVVLTPLEVASVADALARGAPYISPAQVTAGQEAMLSIVVPVRDEDGDPVAALVGRIPGIVLEDLVVGLQGTVGEGSGFIVDERNQIIAHADRAAIMSNWAPPAENSRARRFRVEGPGEAYESLSSETNARQLNYERLGPDHPWRVVISVPHQVVLRLALQISSPLLAVLTLAMVAFGVNLVVLGRGITSPLGDLVQASQQLAAGRFDVQVPTRHKELQYNDEVGQLGHAFERMRRSMQRQFNDIRLMLEVSHDISSSIDIQQGIPIILRGAARGTGAVGVRAIVMNPNGRQPLTFGEGPSAATMAPFDRHIALLGRQENEIALSTPEQVRNGLRLESDQQLPVQAFVAIALVAKDRFQGVLWVGYSQPHEFDDNELNLLRTMANQASVLVENARLFANAEGQWRRLAAVLGSTQDAVIVTDQTDRILLLNPAMSDIFGLPPGVVGRPVAAVLENTNLVHALTEREGRVRNLEIPVPGGRILYASVSPIMSNDRQALGRVAVLHDITHLKELDEMKSEFVSTVSHDLRGPLTFMRGYLTMLPMVGEINEKQEEYLERTLNGVQQMSALVEDLLDLGRIEAGVFLMQDYIDARELLENVVDETTGHAAAQGLRLQVETPPDLPALYGDATLIRRAMNNLVNNACKYAPGTGSVILRAEHEGDKIIFSVQDFGPGIEAKDQVRLFEKFYRVKKKDNPAKGSGLGLAIVKSIVERHGGRAWCQSQPGKGSVFAFSLPLEGRKTTGDDPKQ